MSRILPLLPTLAAPIQEVMRLAWLDGMRTGAIIGLLVGLVFGYLLGRDRGEKGTEA